MTRLRPNEKRAKYAIIFIAIILFIDVIALISAFLQYNLLEEAFNGVQISMERANANDLRQAVILYVRIVLYIVSVVMFIRWFRRAYYNLHTKLDYLNYSEGWAAGAWFVPILNLYRPYQIMDELYVETRNLLIKRGFNIETTTTSNIVGWWWCFWIIYTIASQVAIRVAKRAVSVEDFMLATIFEMVAHITGILVGVFAIKVIKEYSLLEKELVLTDDKVTF